MIIVDQALQARAALGKPVNKTENINLNIDTALQDLI